MTSGRGWTGFSLGLLSLACFTAHSPMRMKGVGRREASPKPFPSDFAPRDSIQQVFWLSDRPPDCVFPVEWSPPVTGFRLATGVPDYSGGTATDLHRVPGYWMRSECSRSSALSSNHGLSSRCAAPRRLDLSAGQRQTAQRRLAFAILIHSLSPGAMATGFALDARTTSMNISRAWLTLPCFRSRRP